VREPRPLIPLVPLAFVLPFSSGERTPSRGPLFRAPEQRASDADRDTAVDILCAAAALSARTIPELAALIADLSGPWAPVPVSPPAAPGWASRARNAGPSCSPWPAGLCNRNRPAIRDG
jgi:hypothetical protein